MQARPSSPPSKHRTDAVCWPETPDPSTKPSPGAPLAWRCSPRPSQQFRERPRSQERRLGTKQSEISVCKRGPSPQTCEMDVVLGTIPGQSSSGHWRPWEREQSPGGRLSCCMTITRARGSKPPALLLPANPVPGRQVRAGGSFQRFRGESFPCLFQFPEAVLILGSHPSATSEPILPTSASAVTSPSLTDPPPPLTRTLVMTLGPPSSPRTISPFEDLN